MRLAAHDSMNFADTLFVIIYLAIGIIGIVLLIGWMLKYFK